MLSLTLIGDLFARVATTVLNGTLQGVGMTAGAHVTKRAIKAAESKLGIAEPEEPDQEVPGMSLQEVPPPTKEKAKDGKGLRELLKDAKQSFTEGMGS